MYYFIYNEFNNVKEIINLSLVQWIDTKRYLLYFSKDNCKQITEDQMDELLVYFEMYKLKIPKY